MICYLDTSALVKLYVREDGSERIRALVEGSEVVATCKIAIAEARAALARAFRSQAINGEGYREAVTSLKADWDKYLRLEVTDGLILLAGDLAEMFSLRGFDAIHLAAIQTLCQGAGEPVAVGCWDAQLWDALKNYRVTVVPEVRPGAH